MRATANAMFAARRPRFTYDARPNTRLKIVSTRAKW